MHSITVVPNLPPLISGVGDYGHRLVECVGQGDHRGFALQVLACGGMPQSECIPSDAFNLTGGSNQPHVTKFLLDCGAGTVLLNYVGYGYARRGAPLWLLRALRTVRRQRPEMAIVTMFHELYASGKPWQSSFWLSPVQRYVAASLARLSDRVASTSPFGVAWLDGVRRPQASPARLLPVFSNVGEPERPLALDARQPVAVVFGASGWRDRVLRARLPVLLRALRAAGFERLLQIGKGGEPLPSGEGIRCESLGILPADEISRHLATASLGITVYPLRLITKSGVAAAYLSHRLPLLLIDDRADGANAAGLPQPGRELLIWRGQGGDLPALDAETLAAVADAGHQWYQSHAHSRHHAEFFFSAADPNKTNPAQGGE